MLIKCSIIFLGFCFLERYSYLLDVLVFKVILFLSLNKDLWEMLFWILELNVIFYIVNFFWSIKIGDKRENYFILNLVLCIFLFILIYLFFMNYVYELGDVEII